MTALIKYEAARRALAEAHRVDEVKDIRDKAAAMQVYAIQAKDRELIEMATDIKLRAERRAGELLREMPKNKGSKDQLQGRNSSGGRETRPPENNAPKLADLDITKDESSRWQKLARMPEKEFEEKLAGVKTSMRAKTEGSKPKTRKLPTDIEKQRKARNEKIIALADQGVTPRNIAIEVGLVGRAVHQILEHERIRRQAKKEPDVARADLSMTAQQKLDAALRAHKSKLDAGFHQAVNKRVHEFLEETILPRHRKEQEQAKQIMRARKGIMDKTSFRLVWSALHPDSRRSISDRKLAEAFDVFSRLEKLLLDEKQSPTDFQKLPSTMAEWDKLRAAAATARRAKHGSGSVARR